MTRYLKRIILINMPPERRWPLLTAALRKKYAATYPETLLNLALDRISHNDVHEGDYGISVRCREDLGDDRSASGAANYWPENECGCRCWSFKSRGECSHTVAAEIYAKGVAVDDLLDDVELEKVTTP